MRCSDGDPPLFRGAHQVRGQAIYLSVSFGAGGVLGSMLAG